MTCHFEGKRRLSNGGAQSSDSTFLPRYFDRRAAACCSGWRAASTLRSYCELCLEHDPACRGHQDRPCARHCSSIVVLLLLQIGALCVHRVVVIAERERCVENGRSVLLIISAVCVVRLSQNLCAVNGSMGPNRPCVFCIAFLSRLACSPPCGSPI